MFKTNEEKDNFLRDNARQNSLFFSTIKNIKNTYKELDRFTTNEDIETIYIKDHNSINDSKSSNDFKKLNTLLLEA